MFNNHAQNRQTVIQEKTLEVVTDYVYYMSDKEKKRKTQPEQRITTEQCTVDPLFNTRQVSTK